MSRRKNDYWSVGDSQWGQLPWSNRYYGVNQFALMFDRRCEFSTLVHETYTDPDLDIGPIDLHDMADRELCDGRFREWLRSYSDRQMPTDGIRLALKAIRDDKPVSDDDRWVWLQEGILRWFDVLPSTTAELADGLTELITKWSVGTQEGERNLPVALLTDWKERRFMRKLERNLVVAAESGNT